MSGRSLPDAVVIGAGLGGLAAALRLSVRGARVTVLERGPRAGGKMNRWSAAGFRFDTGPSLITMPHVFEELFEDAGLRLADHVERVRVDPLARYVYPDGTRFDHTADLPAWLPTVRDLEGGDASGFLRYLALGARLHEISRHTFFAGAPGSLRRPPPAAALRDVPWRDGFGNYHRVVCRHVRSDPLRRLLDRYTTYVGSSPYRTPSTLAVVPYIEYAYGGWHLRGGLYRLVEALLGRLEERGVEVRTSTPAVRLRVERGAVAGVETAGGDTVPARIAVMNGDASRVPALLGGEPARLPDPSLSAFILLLALRRERPGQLHHTVYFSDDYAAEFRDLFEARRFPDDPTVYVNMPSRTDRSMTPGYGEVAFVMANAPAGGTWDAAAAAAARRRVLARLRAGGFAVEEGDVVAEDAWTPGRLASAYDMPGGAIYGAASHGVRGAFLRPPNRHRAVRGLYLAGGSSHPGGGTPTVLLSARIAADLAAGDFAG